MCPKHCVSVDCFDICGNNDNEVGRYRHNPHSDTYEFKENRLWVIWCRSVFEATV